jgi:hypothetical protein
VGGHEPAIQTNRREDVDREVSNERAEQVASGQSRCAGQLNRICISNIIIAGHVPPLPPAAVPELPIGLVLTMSLYLVVHHRRDPDQRFVNSWLDDERLEAITTTVEIGQLCKDAQPTSQPVYVHHCGCSDAHPTVCCSVSIVRVDSADKRTKLVTFAGQQVLNMPPPVTPLPGQSFYFS